MYGSCRIRNVKHNPHILSAKSNRTWDSGKVDPANKNFGSTAETSFHFDVFTERAESEKTGFSTYDRVAQSTYTYRAPQCMSPRRNWDSPNPFAASECALPPGPKGGGAHPPAPKGVGEFQFRRWRKSLALCLLCVEWTFVYV